MREALPLYFRGAAADASSTVDSPDLGEVEAGEVRAHAAGCPACGELLRAYDADERALAALRRTPRSANLTGFADGVMARLAEAGPAAPLPIGDGGLRPLAVLAAAAEPEGKVIRIGSWPAVAALAAALLLALGLLIGTPRTPLPEPGMARGTPSVTPPSIGDGGLRPRAVEPGFAVAPPAARKQPVEPIQVASPERVPMPRRMRRPAGRDGSDVMPVDRGSRRRPEEQLPPEMKELLEKMAPQLQRLFPPPPPPPPRKDEVRF